MTLNSYRDPELRDRRSLFVRHPLGTALGTVVGAFLLLVPIGVRFGQADHVVVHTARLPGGVVDAGVFVDGETTAPSASTTTAAMAITTATVPLTAAALEPVATTGTSPSAALPTTTAKRKTANTAAPKATTTAAKPKSTSTSAVPKPATTVAKTTTTAAKPTTTTTTVAPPTAYSTAQSEAVIRLIWPDDLEAQAVAIATRESSLHNVAHNWCCYGLFAINFTPHQQWLATLGISRPEQLYDPTVNATVAYRLYLMSGWAPWGG
jgi:hypothetical protein